MDQPSRGCKAGDAPNIAQQLPETGTVCAHLIPGQVATVVILRDAPLRTPSRGKHRMGMAAPRYYTADMVRALPADGNKYETVYGELLVTPAPRLWHEILVNRLTFALTAYVRRYPVGLVFGGPGDITWGRTDVLVQPDVFVAPLEEVRTLEWERLCELLLVAEVLSPSSLKADRFTKRRRYQEAGVPLYWVVDGDDHSAEVWTPDRHFPAVEHTALAWHPAGAAEPFRLSLEELFQPV
jgi:Uma2 family endonuclease